MVFYFPRDRELLHKTKHSAQLRYLVISSHIQFQTLPPISIVNSSYRRDGHFGRTASYFQRIDHVLAKAQTRLQPRERNLPWSTLIDSIGRSTANLPFNLVSNTMCIGACLGFYLFCFLFLITFVVVQLRSSGHRGLSVEPPGKEISRVVGHARHDARTQMVSVYTLGVLVV